jgi:uncharacterized protein YegP (UPF0339 family)
LNSSAPAPVKETKRGERLMKLSSECMKSKKPVLEYCLGRPVGRRRPKWGFRFKTEDGEVLMESGERYASLDQAEQGFVAFVKSIATNQYKVAYPTKPAGRSQRN